MSWAEDMDYDGYGHFDEDGVEIQLHFIKILIETKLAWLILFEISEDLSTVEIWLPKSQCAIVDLSIFVPDWLVDQNELWEYEKVT